MLDAHVSLIDFGDRGDNLKNRIRRTLPSPVPLFEFNPSRTVITGRMHSLIRVAAVSPCQPKRFRYFTPAWKEAMFTLFYSGTRLIRHIPESQDARIYKSSDGVTRGIFTRSNFSDPGRYGTAHMVLVDLFSGQETRLRLDHAKPIEKNWVPLRSDANYEYFVYEWCPTIVTIKCRRSDGACVHDTRASSPLCALDSFANGAWRNRVHGGSPVIARHDWVPWPWCTDRASRGINMHSSPSTHQEDMYLSCSQRRALSTNHGMLNATRRALVHMSTCALVRRAGRAFRFMNRSGSQRLQ